MIIVIDFDGTVVSDDREFTDCVTPFVLMPFVNDGLRSLIAAGHTLILSSCRANRAQRFNPALNFDEHDEDPDVIDWKIVEYRQIVCEMHRQRYAHMVRWVRENLPGIFEHIDDGVQGKIIADLYIDNRGVSYGEQRLALDWLGIARTWGETFAAVAWSQ